MRANHITKAIKSRFPPNKGLGRCNTLHCETVNPLANEVPVKYNHLGIPTTSNFEGEIDLPHLKITVSDHENNPFGIQWQRYWENAPYPDLVKTIPHVAFEVDDLSAALAGHKVIIQPNSPSEGLLVAFVEVNGAPVELMQYVDKPNDNS